MKKLFLSFLAALLVCSVGMPIFAADVSQIEKSTQDIEKEKSLLEKIFKRKQAPKIEEKLPAEEAPKLPEEKVMVKKITVTGVTLLSQKEIDAIIWSYQNKQISLREMQKVADLITDSYRKKGYITSRAYLPPQKIQAGILEIRVVEGITGDIDIKGNKYFKTALYRKQVKLKRGDPFNYEILRKGLSRINDLADRNAKAVLVPGKEPGSTDVLLEAKDRLPIHIGLDWDNFGSRYIKKDRYRVTLTDNNLLGLDDILTLQYQTAESASINRLFILRYLFPVTDTLDIGFLTVDSKINLQEEFKDTNTRSKSRLYNLFATQSLINTETASLSLNFGFDYKNIINFTTGTLSSRDRMRVLKVGEDLGITDKFGRSLITHEIDFGIPDIMGGLDSKDINASRSGSGGKFIKNNFNLLRLQKMPYDSTLLWKNQIQISPYILSGAEQYQIGGIANVRGYPPAEVVGDNGYAMTWEWSVPPYFVSKNIRVPYSKAKVYDALRVVTFYDWANVHLHRTSAGEEKNTTLRGAGVGLRLNLPEDFTVRAEFAWALDRTPSDSNRFHPYFQISKEF